MGLFRLHEKIDKRRSLVHKTTDARMNAETTTYDVQALRALAEHLKSLFEFNGKKDVR